MSALFDFRAFLTVLLLFICTCTFVRAKAPQLVDKRTGYAGNSTMSAKCPGNDTLTTEILKTAPCTPLLSADILDFAACYGRLRA